MVIEITEEEPEIIINGNNVGPGCALTIRRAIEVLAHQIALDCDFPGPRTDMELNKMYMDRIDDILKCMGKGLV